MCFKLVHGVDFGIDLSDLLFFRSNPYTSWQNQKGGIRNIENKKLWTVVGSFSNEDLTSVRKTIIRASFS
jgi:hypothetical protein